MNVEAAIFHVEHGGFETSALAVVAHQLNVGQELHFDDIAKLLDAFERLLRSGGSILIIEHNLEVIRCADWVIDLGPEGGDRGGRIVAEGTPEQIAEVAESYTGRYLKKELIASNTPR